MGIEMISVEAPCSKHKLIDFNLNFHSVSFCVKLHVTGWSNPHAASKPPTFRWQSRNDPILISTNSSISWATKKSGCFKRKYTGITPAGAILLCKFDSMKSEPRTHQREWDSDSVRFLLVVFLRLLVVLVAAHKESHLTGDCKWVLNYLLYQFDTGFHQF